MYELYRFYNADGSAKEWAMRAIGNGNAEIRWGPQDRLKQSQVKPSSVASARASRKMRKGYEYVGVVEISADGLVSFAAKTPTRPPMPTPQSPRKKQRTQRAVPPVDLSALSACQGGIVF